MPLHYRNVRYRSRTLSPTRRQRLAFSDGKVVEVQNYYKRNGSWIKAHKRRKPRK